MGSSTAEVYIYPYRKYNTQCSLFLYTIAAIGNHPQFDLDLQFWVV